MLAVLLGLGASIAWGCGDFLGGLQSRRRPLLTVLLVSQAFALVLFTATLAIRGVGPGGDADFVLYAALAGIAEAIGLAALYRGLAMGAMGVVAPLSALSAVVPIVVSLTTGNAPGPVEGAGIALGVVGVMLASREGGETKEAPKRIAAGVGLALVAALGIGLFYVGIDAASERADPLWAVFVNRVALVSLYLVALLATRTPVDLDLRSGSTLLGLGLLDIGGTSLFAAATTEGFVGSVAVLGSMYPLTTIVLARLVLKERIQPSQRIGTLIALAAVALITAGTGGGH